MTTAERHRPLVTIAIPTYNRAKTSLPQAIGCAVNQTYPNIEVIVADNSSSDNTEEVVLGFRDPRVRYYRHPVNIGPFGNMNFCLQQAAGLYFHQLDDDDLIDQDFVEACVAAAARAPHVGLVRTGTRVVTGSRVLYEYPNLAGGLSAEEFVQAWFAGRVQLYQCSTLFNTARLREIGGFGSTPDLLIDNTVSVVLALRWGRVDVPEIKATFRRHEGGFGSHAKIAVWCKDSLRLLRTVQALLPSGDAALWREGRRFFAHQNFARAQRVSRRLSRFRAYLTVLQAFGFQYFPLSPGWLQIGSEERPGRPPV
jgi:glycosyltransferase involved in cell wall biosynthesis